MVHRLGARWLTGIGLAAAALFWFACPAQAQHRGDDCFHCEKHHCPPPLRHCVEGAPRIKFHRGCPRPICNPCTAPAWGYYQTCWTPWPFPPDWNHCPVQPPAAVVQPGLLQPGILPAPGVIDENLHTPRTKPGI